MTDEPRAMPGPFSGLSVKLIATIIFVILAVEIVIYLPSLGNFRATWLDDTFPVPDTPAPWGPGKPVTRGEAASWIGSVFETIGQGIY